MNINIEGDVEQSKGHTVVEIIDYIPHASLSKTIIKRPTGIITALSFDAGAEMDEKRSPFDTYIQIIDGIAELDILDKKFVLKTGEGIVIPAHARYSLHANVRFKMICTIIKSGYDEVN